MRKIFYGLLFLLLVNPGGVHARVVKIGYFVNDPHITQNQNTAEPEGVLVTFLQDIIAPEMGVTFKLIKHPLIRILASMDQGIIDGAVLFGHTPNRANKYDYPKNSFASMQSAIIVKKNNALGEIVRTDDISDMKISYALGAIATPFMSNKKIKMELTTGENPLARNLMLLQLGRTDAVYWPDKMAAIYTLKKLRLKGEVKILRIPENEVKLFTIFSKASKTKNLKDRYDKAFEKVDGKSLYHKMMDSYINDTAMKNR